MPYFKSYGTVPSSQSPTKLLKYRKIKYPMKLYGENCGSIVGYMLCMQKVLGSVLNMSRYIDQVWRWFERLLPEILENYCQSEVTLMLLIEQWSDSVEWSHSVASYVPLWQVGQLYVLLTELCFRCGQISQAVIQISVYSAKTEVIWARRVIPLPYNNSLKNKSYDHNVKKKVSWFIGSDQT